MLEILIVPPILTSVIEIDQLKSNDAAQKVKKKT